MGSGPLKDESRWWNESLLSHFVALDPNKDKLEVCGAIHHAPSKPPSLDPDISATRLTSVATSRLIPRDGPRSALSSRSRSSSSQISRHQRRRRPFSWLDLIPCIARGCRSYRLHRPRPGHGSQSLWQSLKTTTGSTGPSKRAEANRQIRSRFDLMQGTCPIPHIAWGPASSAHDPSPRHPTLTPRCPRWRVVRRPSFPGRRQRGEGDTRVLIGKGLRWVVGLGCRWGRVEPFFRSCSSNAYQLPRHPPSRACISPRLTWTGHRSRDAR
ncbi:hypothetical protein SERLA73DRAFT_79496 [Serpula lacrymans var. lacrymans S7.3]|uniref:Uncharacterized protein n=1 Tax=Serpula lacrymans var. lacrymans (strain S7.3) TaxID=936435 RepID=F8QGM3_SERL3|nr:hypothetical protein SERLA73DRAFT_79496 [Serpula lacrymans var. lacrymans S7.3]